MPKPPIPTENVPLATQFQIRNDARVVVFTGRDQFALQDTQLAVPFALLKHLTGSLVTAEGQAELPRLDAYLSTEELAKQRTSS